MKYFTLFLFLFFILSGCGENNRTADQTDITAIDAKSLLQQAKQLDSEGKPQEALKLIDSKEIKLIGDDVTYYLDLVKRVEGTGLFISSHELKQDNEYMTISATISNGSKSNEYSNVKVKVVYYDADDNVLNTDWTYAVDSLPLKPQESKDFEIMTKHVDGVKRYMLQIQE